MLKKNPPDTTPGEHQPNAYFYTFRPEYKYIVKIFFMEKTVAEFILS